MTILFALAASAATANVAPDYNRPDTWLCRPDHHDACDVDLSATVVAADGSRKMKPFRPSAKPTFDCFYLYPTVSTDTSLNADLKPGEEEAFAVQRQVARFRSVCRLYAPLYRQVTLSGLLRLAAGGPDAVAAQEMVYDDIKAAWDNYLKRDNQGRGVVLIGHSQGAVALKRLVAREIDGKAIQGRVISALLLGTNIAVPIGRDIGGDFKAMPLCRSASQIGCIVTYVSFRAEAPPPTGGHLGVVKGEGITTACTNPAALGGGSAILHSYLPAVGRPNSTPMGPWTADGAAITTPFVAVPGLISGQCISKNGTSYLAITTNADPKDPRTDRIGGDARLGASWGLHLIDVNVVMGDLIALVGQQAKAWRNQGAHDRAASQYNLRR